MKCWCGWPLARSIPPIWLRCRVCRCEEGAAGTGDGAWARLQIARQAGAHAIVQTAAASALGRMVNRLARLRSVRVISVMRRDAQAETLRSLGAEHILNSESPDFDIQLRDLCRQLDAQLAFDAVAGAMTARLLGAMLPEARVVVYGGLAGELISVNPI